MNIGFDHTSGAMGAVLIATNPLFAVAFSHFLVAGDRMTPMKAAGLLVAMAGTSLAIVGNAGVAGLDLGTVGDWIVLSSAVVLGLRLAVGARLVRRIDPTKVVMWQMLLSLPLFGAGALLLEEIAWDRVGGRSDCRAALSGHRGRGTWIHGVVPPDEALYAERDHELQLRLADRRSAVRRVAARGPNRFVAARRNGPGCRGNLPRHATTPKGCLTRPDPSRTPRPRGGPWNAQGTPAGLLDGSMRGRTESTLQFMRVAMGRRRSTRARMSAASPARGTS